MWEQSTRPATVTARISRCRVGPNSRRRERSQPTTRGGPRGDPGWVNAQAIRGVSPQRRGSHDRTGPDPSAPNSTLQGAPHVEVAPLPSNSERAAALQTMPVASSCHGISGSGPARRGPATYAAIDSGGRGIAGATRVSSAATTDGAAIPKTARTRLTSVLGMRRKLRAQLTRAARGVAPFGRTLVSYCSWEATAWLTRQSVARNELRSGPPWGCRARDRMLISMSHATRRRRQIRESSVLFWPERVFFVSARHGCARRPHGR
jgi:hypothetical protein